MKYGLAFKKYDEDVGDLVVDTKDEIEQAPGEKFNYLYEGDNIHSLTLLEESYTGKVDVIYIDPPYNTGSKGFIYNDNFSEAGDKHSQWLSFMANRLEIAKRLLSDKGIIFISINERELAQLRLLCDSIFEESNFIENFIWIKNCSKNASATTSTVHEYILCYAKDKKLVSKKQDYFRMKKEGALEVLDFVDKLDDKKHVERQLKDLYKKHPEWKGIKQYRHFDGEVYRKSNMNDPAGCMYNKRGNSRKIPPSYVIHPITGKPCNPPNGGYRYEKETFDALLANGKICFGEDHTIIPRVKTYLKDCMTEPIKSTIIECYGGRKELTDMNIVFDNAKPTSLIKKLIACGDKNALVLDFFAGSGTTGQAVLELNKEDGGDRTFILCNNNENNICEDITFQRIKTVITGIRKDGSKYSDGLPANLKYITVKEEK